jgi:hypothetical protein
MLLFVAVTLIFGMTANAAVQNMNGWFSIDVPEDWTVNKPEDGLFVRLISPEGDEVVTFEYSSSEGMDSRQYAENMSGSLGGSSPVKETERGDFEFVYADNGVDTTARAFMIGSVGIVMTSPREFDDIYGILDTFTW